MSQSVSSSPSVATTSAAVTQTSSSFGQGDLDLDVILQGLVVQLTGLSGSLVRPRWQATEPLYPEYGTTWAAIGVTSQDADVNTMSVPVSEGLAVHRHETLTVVSSFYGPNAAETAGMLRDGMFVDINRGVLDNNGMAILRIGAVSRSPVLLNQKWQNRVDFQFMLRRHTIRVYPISTVIESGGSVTDGETSQDFDTGVIE